MTAAATAARSRPGDRALWFGLLGAPAAWSLQEMASYAVSVVSCRAGAAGTGPPLPVVAVSVVALVVAVAALATAIRNFRAAPGERGDGPLARAVGERVGFMGFTGIVTGTIFTIGVLLTALGPFVLVPCA